MSRRARAPRHWARVVPGSPIPLVSLLESARLNRMPCDHALERRALVILRCLDLWAPTALGKSSIATARLLAAVDPIRAPERWSGGDPPLVSLVDHLVKAVRYPLPAFLYPIVARPSHDARLALAILAFVGAGNPLRKPPGLPPLSAREGHLVWTTERADSVVAAVRRAQVLAAGGPEWLAEALCTTALGQLVPDETHWGHVIRWLAANHGGLCADRIGPIVDYLRSGRIVPTSVTRLVREERRWHEQTTRARPAAGLSGPLPRSGYPNLRLEDGGATWTFDEIHTGEALHVEGSVMQHCVATYFGVIHAGRSSIWSMRKDGARCLTLEVWNGDRAVVQIRGQRNRRATPDELRVLERWASSLELTVRDR